MSLIIFRKKKAAFEKILESYSPPDSPTTLIADFYALDAILAVFRSSSDLPRGFLREDLSALQDTRDVVGEKLYKTLSVVLGYAIIREGRYTLGSPTAIKDAETAKYIADNLYEGITRDAPSNDVLNFLNFINQGSNTTAEEAAKELFFDMVDDLLQVIKENAKPKKPDSGEEVDLGQQIVNPSYVNYKGETVGVDPDDPNALTLEQAIDQFGVDFAKEKWGEDLVNQYMRSLEAQPQGSPHEYNYDLFEGTEHEFNAIQAYGLDINSVIGSVTDYLDLYDGLEIIQNAEGFYNFLRTNPNRLANIVAIIWLVDLSVEEAFMSLYNDYMSHTPTDDLAPSIFRDYYKYIELCDRQNLSTLMSEASTYINAANEALPHLKVAFGSPNIKWSVAYGGKKWYNITLGYEKLRQNKAIESLDFAVDIVHNNGNVFDKVRGLNVSEKELYAILDTKTAMGGQFNEREDSDYKSMYEDGEYVPMTNLTPHVSNKLTAIYDRFAKSYEKKHGEDGEGSPLQNYLQPSPEWLGRQRMSKKLNMR